MKERIKVEGKAGNLGNDITVELEGDGKLVVDSKIPLSKRSVGASVIKWPYSAKFYGESAADTDFCAYQIPKILDKEVPTKAQHERLATCCRNKEGYFHIEILQRQHSDRRGCRINYVRLDMIILFSFFTFSSGCSHCFEDNKTQKLG